jgi:threonine/homoserine/homoserine lactone efflux protein
MTVPDSAWFASAVAFAVAMSASPGPNNALVTASAANFGLRRSLPFILGVALGFPLMLIAVALGLAPILQSMPQLLPVLRGISAAWLVWLAWRIAVANPHAAEESRLTGRSRPISFLEAAAFQWVNPKAWLIATSSLTTFTGNRSVLDSIVLALLFALAALVSLAGWAVLGAGLARLLPHPRAMQWFNRGIAMLLLLSLLPLLLAD